MLTLPKLHPILIGIINIGRTLQVNVTVKITFVGAEYFISLYTTLSLVGIAEFIKIFIFMSRQRLDPSSQLC